MGRILESIGNGLGLRDVVKAARSRKVGHCYSRQLVSDFILVIQAVLSLIEDTLMNLKEHTLMKTERDNLIT